MGNLTVARGSLRNRVTIKEPWVPFQRIPMPPKLVFETWWHEAGKDRVSRPGWSWTAGEGLGTGPGGCNGLWTLGF